MWYEKFNLKEDPYDIRTLSKDVIGEDVQKEKLIQWISRGKACLLYGPTGSGKTTLASTLFQKCRLNRVPQLSSYDVYYYSCDRDNLDHIQIPKKNKKRWYEKLITSEPEPQKEIVLILDEEHFAQHKEIIRISALWDIKTIHSVVYVQIHEKPALPQLVRRIGPHRVGLRTINRDEIVTLLKQRSSNIPIFEDNALQHIASNCSLNPSLALQHCAQVAEDIAGPDHPITLDQVKSYDFEGQTPQREVQMVNPIVQDGIEKVKNISPAHKHILRQLRITSSTIEDLSGVCGMSKKAVAARLGELRKKEMVEIKDNSRPKRYGLIAEFERQLLTDAA